MLYQAKSLNGYQLNGKDGEVGKVKDFLFDDKYWTVRYLVADTGEWISNRKVLLSPYSLLEVNRFEKYVSINLTKKQIEDSPSIDTHQPVSKQFESAYYGHYGWPSYWTGAYMWGGYPSIMQDSEPRSELIRERDSSWDPHLRSTHDVRGRHVEASDGNIGHISDFIIDDENWAIRYLVVETRNILPGEKVLISPQWIERISFDESKVFINLTQRQIEDSPKYKHETAPTREDERILYEHYHREAYWKDEDINRSRLLDHVRARQDKNLDNTLY
jgi:hypothetical protein